VSGLEKLYYTFLIALCCSVLLWVTPYYFYSFFLCSINKKKENLYKYIYEYKEAKFGFYASLDTLIGRSVFCPAETEFSFHFMGFSGTAGRFGFSATGRARGDQLLIGSKRQQWQKEGYHFSLTITPLV